MQQINTLESSRDKPRDIHRVSMKIKVRPNIGGFTLPDGNYIEGGGEYVIKVYEDNVPLVEANVETAPESIKAATRAFNLEMADQLRRVSESGRSAQEMLKLIEADKLSDEEKELRAKVLARTGSSMEAHFHKLEGRGILPLLSAKLVEGSREIEPQRARELRAAQIMAEAVAAASKNTKA